MLGVKEVFMSTRRGILAGAVLLAAALLGGCFLFPNRPPEAAFVVGYDVDPGDPLIVELDASSSADPDGDPIVAFSWVFGDDVDIITPLEHTKLVEIPVIRVRYPVEGTYTVTLLVRDDQGNSSAPTSKTVTVPNLPVAPTQ